MVENVRLKPITVNGTTYGRGEAVPMAELVKAWGGRIVQLHLQNGRLKVQGARRYYDGEMFGKDAAHWVTAGAVSTTVRSPGDPAVPTPAPVTPQAAPAQPTALSGDEEFVEVDLDVDMDLIDPSSMLISEVRTWVEAHPGSERDILALEAAGTNRPRLTRWLEERLA